MTEPKTILITGASSGFGRACAERFASEGWKLILIARREERLQAMQSALSEQTEIHSICVDIREKDKLDTAIKAIPHSFQYIDVCLNNAGLALGLEPAPDANLEDWETMIDTNIKGLLYTTKAVLNEMVKQGQGHVVNLGSIAGNYAYPGANTYGATKAFVKMFSQNLKADLLGTGVKVTNIEPGLAETEFSVVRFKGDKAQANNVYQGTQPLTAKDIAEIIFWVVNTPAHVNINSLEVMPTCQAWGLLAVHRD